jgi:hypothetical protein
VRCDLSVLELAGRTLWCASDETASLERLLDGGDGRFAEHTSYPLSDFIDLPGGPSQEADLEGLAMDGRYLWLVGSHSLKRKRPRPDEKDPDVALNRLTRIEREPNRYLLARLPLVESGDGVWAPAKGRDAAVLKMKRKGGNRLTRALQRDVHLGPFLDVPSKDNGFDVEGIAVRGDRVFLGLRGPVLRGWAVVLELRVATARNNRLKLAEIGPAGAPYRKHFLPLEGLGIRELHLSGDDLLILAGPTMDLDGPVEVFRWRHPFASQDHQIVPAADIEHRLTLPHGRGTDHAEGIVVLPHGSGRERLLVVYDSPDPARLHDDGRSIDCDVFALT